MSSDPLTLDRHPARIAERRRAFLSPVPPATHQAERMQELLCQAGVIVGLCGADHNVLKINPPLCLAAADVGALAAACDDVLTRH